MTESVQVRAAGYDFVPAKSIDPAQLAEGRFGPLKFPGGGR